MNKDQKLYVELKQEIAAQQERNYPMVFPHSGREVSAFLTADIRISRMDPADTVPERILTGELPWKPGYPTNIYSSEAVGKMEKCSQVNFAKCLPAYLRKSVIPCTSTLPLFPPDPDAHNKNPFPDMPVTQQVPADNLGPYYMIPEIPGMHPAPAAGLPVSNREAPLIHPDMRQSPCDI